jgi:hypothetical protein
MSHSLQLKAEQDIKEAYDREQMHHKEYSDLHFIKIPKMIHDYLTRIFAWYKLSHTRAGEIGINMIYIPEPSPNIEWINDSMDPSPGKLIKIETNDSGRIFYHVSIKSDTPDVSICFRQDPGQSLPFKIESNSDS